MRIKVIIVDGIVTSVLTDGDAEIEIIDINQDYRDCRQLCAYEEELHRDAELRESAFTVANFCDDSE
ncbi:hypothetical protein [Pseudoflavonifractor sp. An184]|uniref:hypothetical protein n=1 Tax=Pseudoflavonifractor sp. An184 TaxID=1965576 RepID=UPI000B3A1138|nr:hypothetical protein [Pseudoflavonifractor sp. An184]OUP56902.1 hypothetical protein B5F19_05170 [Pseudoflavonifractor sp. An184]